MFRLYGRRDVCNSLLYEGTYVPPCIRTRMKNIALLGTPGCVSIWKYGGTYEAIMTM